MLRRFLVAFTAVFIGGLAIEVLNYHQIATLHKDPWAVVPQLSGTLFLFAALLVLASPRRTTIRLFEICCGISIVVGLAGVAFHWASHGLTPATFGTSTSWFGDPPPLAPLEFAVVGLLGLVAATWERGGALAPPRSVAALACYLLAALLSLIALILAAAFAPETAFLAVGAALTIGALGYLIELVSEMGSRRTA